MGSQEAARELLENTDLKQQRQALIQMKPHRAAALLEVSSPLLTRCTWCQHWFHATADYKHPAVIAIPRDGKVQIAARIILLEKAGLTVTFSAFGSAVSLLYGVAGVRALL